ncbi:hypothetical protein Tco_1155296, partial [Tanacetum coccineum]
VRFTTLIAKFLILDIPIDRDAPIVVGRGFLRTIGGIVNTSKRLFSTFDGFCHQTFRAARFNVLRNGQGDSDDEEEYEKKRNKFGAPYMTMGGNDDEAGSSRSKRSRQYETVEEVLLAQVHHEFLLWEGCNNEAKSRIMLRRKAESNEEIFTSIAWIRAFNIKEPIYSELCHEFYSTYEFDEVYWYCIMLMKDGFDVCFQGDLRSDDHFNAQEYWLRALSGRELSLVKDPALYYQEPNVWRGDVDPLY